MQEQGLWVQRRQDARRRAQGLRGGAQGAARVPHRLQQQGGHHGDMGQPQRSEVMGQREEDVGVIAGQEPRALHGQPALGLEVGALRTGAVPTGVVPDARHMAVRTGLDMAAERGGPARHDGPRGAADMAGQRMGLLVDGKRVLKDGLQRHESHQGLPQR
jgi:hypothetical protein